MAQRLGPEHFLVAAPQEGEHSDGFLLQADTQPYFLALDKRGKHAQFQPCIFLVDLANGSGRCGIYASRPGTCRAYPMSIKRYEVELHENNICTPGSWSQEEIARPSWRAAVKQNYMEFDIYSEVAKRWNARVAHSLDQTFHLADYLEYLMNVYGLLDRLERNTPPDTLALIRRAWPTPPRSGGHYDELRLCQGDLPWLDYLLRAREAIDRLYPHIPPQPILIPMLCD